MIKSPCRSCPFGGDPVPPDEVPWSVRALFVRTSVRYAATVMSLVAAAGIGAVLTRVLG